MKMDPALKVAMALCVLLGGVSASLMFRRNPPPQASSVPATAEQLRIRSRGVPTPVAQSQELRSSLPAERCSPEASSSPRPTVVVKPLDRQASPPPLASNYPETDRTASPRWGTSMEMMLPAKEKETARTHRIVDGDTLEGLAQSYLGSADRAREIFAANRDVLADPKLLPIGAELKIPATVHQ
jgi:nucleoid-associated protein YgaU